MLWTLEVFGEPAPQGSKRPVGCDRQGRTVLVESSRKVKPWRLAVSTAAIELQQPLIEAPVELQIVFRFLRPKGHFGRRGLLPSAPLFMAKRPDLDKLERSTLDGLQGALLREDSQVCRLIGEKRYCEADEKPGATITIRVLNNDDAPEATTAPGAPGG